MKIMGFKAMSENIRPAVEVWDDAIAAWAADTIDTRQAAAAVIQAYGDEREAKGREEQAAELAKWRDKYNELGQMALEQVSDLGTKLGRLDVELDAAKADLQAANRDLAKLKALAETLAGAMRRIYKTASHPTNPSRNLVDIKSVSDLALHKYDAALREYKEARAALAGDSHDQ